MDQPNQPETFVSGGPTEAGLIVIQVLAAIAGPIIGIAALVARTPQLLGGTFVAVAAFLGCRFLARRTPQELTISQEEVTFRRASGSKESYAKRQLYVEKRLSNYGGDALFCVKHSYITFRFPLEFTTNAVSGEALTIESLRSRGIEVR